MRTLNKVTEQRPSTIARDSQGSFTLDAFDAAASGRRFDLE